MGKYKLVEHNENYVMESNSCIPDNYKSHFPQPTGVMKQRPNEDHILNKLHDTPLSEDAREAFFQARNMGMDTFMTGIQPAVTENGAQPVKIIPDYTENPTLEDIFLPSTVNGNETIPYGLELYTPSSHANNRTTSFPASQSLLSLSSRSGSVASVFSEPHVFTSSYNKTNQHHHSRDQANLSPSSGYQSSPNPQSTSSDSNPLEFLSSEELDNTDFDELINSLSSEPQKQTEPLKKSVGQVDSTFDSIIDELLMESLLNNEDNYPDLLIHDQSFYHNHNGN